MAKKCLYVATVVKTHIMEFHIPFLQMLKDEGWETAVAAKNDYENPEDCNIPYCDTYFDIDFARQPFSKKNIKAYKELKHILNAEHYDIVHCHTPVGGVLTRLAARRARKNGTRVIYTAHGFHFYKGAPFINWLIYFPIEYICAFMTDTLITINQEDYNRAKKHLHAKQVEYVPGVGIDLDKFSPNILTEEQKKAKRKELGLKANEKMILSVGELTKNKNHEAAIRALSKIKDIEWQYYIAGRGELNNYLQKLISDLNLQDRVHLLGYRTDIPELNVIADLFVFPSLREGLPIALLEAIASRTPVLCNNIRGCLDLVQEDSIFFDKTIEKIEYFLKDEVVLPQYNLSMYSSSQVLEIVKNIYFGE